MSNVISLYSFTVLVTNHADNKMLEKLLNKDIKEINTLAENNIVEIHNLINNVYNALSDEGLKNIVIELRKLEVTDNEKELILDIKNFQNTNISSEITANEFIKMLDYCKIKAPKPCYKVLENIKNDKSMRICTMNKASFTSVYNAITKLLNFQLTV